MIYETLRRKTKEELIDMLIQENLNNVDGTKATLKELWDLKIDYTQENFILMCLDSDNKVLKKKVLFKGSP